MAIEINKVNVRAYYEMAFSGQPERAVENYMGPRYIQHNPEAANGPEASLSTIYARKTPT